MKLDILFLFVAAAVSGHASAQVDVQVDWRIPYVGDPSITVEVGSVLDFVFQGSIPHDVQTVPTQEEFDACDFTRATVICDQTSEESICKVKVTEGTQYFVCTVGSHCTAQGQKVMVFGTVATNSSSTGTDSTNSPSPDTVNEPTSTPSTESSAPSRSQTAESYRGPSLTLVLEALSYVNLALGVLAFVFTVASRERVDYCLSCVSEITRNRLKYGAGVGFGISDSLSDVVFAISLANAGMTELAWVVGVCIVCYALANFEMALSVVVMEDMDTGWRLLVLALSLMSSARVSVLVLTEQTTLQRVSTVLDLVDDLIQAVLALLVLLRVAETTVRVDHVALVSLLLSVLSIILILLEVCEDNKRHPKPTNGDTDNEEPSKVTDDNAENEAYKSADNEEQQSATNGGALDTEQKASVPETVSSEGRTLLSEEVWNGVRNKGKGEDVSSCFVRTRLLLRISVNNLFVGVVQANSGYEVAWRKNRNEAALFKCIRTGNSSEAGWVFLETELSTGAKVHLAYGYHRLFVDQNADKFQMLWIRRGERDRTVKLSFNTSGKALDHCILLTQPPTSEASGTYAAEADIANGTDFGFEICGVRGDSRCSLANGPVKSILSS